MAFRITTWAMTALLIVAAVVQYNDPDPWVWIALYLIAAFLSVLALRTPWPKWIGGALGGACLLWGLYLLPTVIEAGRVFDLEEGREMLGLWLVAGWMGFLFFRTRNQSPAAKS